MRKRILVCFATAVLTALCLCLGAATAEKHWATATVKLTVVENTAGAVSGTVALHWNGDALAFVSAEAAAKGVTAPESADGVFTFQVDKALSGTLGTVTLQVLGDTPLGHYLVAPEVVSAENAAGEAVTLTLRGDFVQVEEGAVKTPVPAVTPEPTATPAPLLSAVAEETGESAESAEETGESAQAAEESTESTEEMGESAESAEESTESTESAGATAAPLSGVSVWENGGGRQGIHIGPYQMAACSLGPRFRDVKPGSTDRWWMFTPVDLTTPGVQTFDLVAGNIHYVGTVTVRVDSDSLTVDYRLVDSAIQVDSEFLTVLTALPDTLNLDELTPCTFGRPIRLTGDLAGRDQVLLLICNQLSYHTAAATHVTRFYPDSDSYAQLAQAAMAGMGE